MQDNELKTRRYDKKEDDNIRGIVREKSGWQNAYDSGDKEGMERHAAAAKKYYDSLVSSGNYDTAKQLHEADYTKAKSIYDEYVKGKPETDEDLYQKQKVQTVNAAGDMKDSADRAEDYIYGLNDKQTKRIDDNYMKSDTAKSILSSYRNLGTNAKSSAYADGSVRNDGNMDSFAAANGARQAAAYENAGQATALDYYNSKVAAGQNQIKDFNTSMGVMSGARDAAAARNESIMNSMANNRDEERLTAIKENESAAAITGEIPESVARRNNPYFDENGDVINTDLDYEAIVQDELARGNKEAARQAYEAGIWKTQHGWGEYSGGRTYVEAPVTEARRAAEANEERLDKTANAEIDYNNRALDVNAELKREEIDKNYRANLVNAAAGTVGNNGIQAPVTGQIMNMAGGGTANQNVGTAPSATVTAPTSTSAPAPSSTGNVKPPVTTDEKPSAGGNSETKNTAPSDEEIKQTIENIANDDSLSDEEKNEMYEAYSITPAMIAQYMRG